VGDGTAPNSIACWITYEKGDVLLVARLDRLSRSLRDLLAIMEKIQEAEAGFRSLSEVIDMTTAPGRMMMQMVGAFAEFERAILRERTKAGLDAARKRGVHRRTSSQAQTSSTG
jgi:DNA invertase Pin-like site-specific DNA recombinase